jgi:hypothetical protein
MNHARFNHRLAPTGTAGKFFAISGQDSSGDTYSYALATEILDTTSGTPFTWGVIGYPTSTSPTVFFGHAEYLSGTNDVVVAGGDTATGSGPTLTPQSTCFYYH